MNGSAIFLTKFVLNWALNRTPKKCFFHFQLSKLHNLEKIDELVWEHDAVTQKRQLAAEELEVRREPFISNLFSERLVMFCRV